MRALVWGMAALLALLLYALVFGDGGLLDWREQAAELQRVRGENAALAERNRALEVELEDLRSGLEGIEEQARRQLGMIREGETFYRLVEPDPAAEPADGAGPDADGP